jgi:putative membrane protein
MLGALNKVWPWKETIESFVSPSGKVKPLVEKNLLPGAFEAVTGRESHWAAAIAFAVAGFCLVYFLDRWAAQRTPSPAAPSSHPVA